MGKVTIRNRNAGKFDKNGKRKPPNWEHRFETAPVDGKRRQKTKAEIGRASCRARVSAVV